MINVAAMNEIDHLEARLAWRTGHPIKTVRWRLRAQTVGCCASFECRLSIPNQQQTTVQSLACGEEKTLKGAIS